MSTLPSGTPGTILGVSPVFLKCLPPEKQEVASGFHLCFPVADVSVFVSCYLIPVSRLSQVLEPVLCFHCLFFLIDLRVNKNETVKHTVFRPSF